MQKEKLPPLTKAVERSKPKPKITTEHQQQNVQPNNKAKTNCYTWQWCHGQCFHGLNKGVQLRTNFHKGHFAQVFLRAY